MSEWYKKSFGNDYLLVYKHRDLQGAYAEVRSMMEWLQPPEGAEVLDLCCGMGRHSMALNRFGFHVTGVDLSDVLLTEARRLDTEEEVRWVQGDMRQVPLNETFDAVVNLFTSFGYFDTDEEKRAGAEGGLPAPEAGRPIHYRLPEPGLHRSEFGSLFGARGGRHPHSGTAPDRGRLRPQNDCAERSRRG
ncbi:methyltransferase domain-containing protein [Paenibacillus sp. P26]|nr:methyltransferase domain-containing protein [Paenibacillus sp. P26]